MIAATRKNKLREACVEYGSQSTQPDSGAPQAGARVYGHDLGAASAGGRFAKARPRGTHALPSSWQTSGTRGPAALRNRTWQAVRFRPCSGDCLQTSGSLPGQHEADNALIKFADAVRCARQAGPGAWPGEQWVPQM